MAGPLGKLLVVLGLDSREFDMGIGRAQKSIAGFGRGADLAIAAGAGAITAGLLGTLDAAREWETAFAGVRKTLDTTGLTAEQEAQAFGVLEEELRGLSQTIPITSTELAGLAEAGGALGIAREDLTEFARVTALIGTTTDVSADQAAVSLGKLGTIIGLNAEDYEHLGSALVELGNKGASFESEILGVSDMIAGTTKVIGLSAQEMLGWAAAIANVGIEPERAGGAFQKFGLTIQSAKIAGLASATTSGLAEMAEAAGLTNDAFLALDQQGAMEAVIKGLSEMDDATRSLAIRSMGFTEIRVFDFLARLGSNYENVADAQANASREWTENNALAEEAAKRFATVDSQVQIFWNRVNDLGITLGEALIPPLTATVEHVGNFVTILGDAAKAFPAVTAVVTPLVTALAGLTALRFTAKFMGLGSAFDAVGTKAASAFSSTFFPGLASQSGLGKMKALGLGWGKVLGLGMAAAIIVILGDELSKMADKIKTQFATLQGANVAEQISAGALSLEEMNAQLATLEKSLVDVRVQQFTFGPLWNVADFFGVFPSQAEIEAEINTQRAAIQAEVDRIARGERGIEAEPGARATLFGAMAEGAHAQADELIDEMDRVAAEMGAVEGTAPDLAGPIEEEFAVARKAIKAGFGSIKEALKNPPQLISRADRIENMEERQKRTTRELNRAVEADDPWNIAYWTKAAAKQQMQLDTMRGKGRTTTKDVARDFAGMGLDIQGTMFDLPRYAKTAAEGVKAAFTSQDMMAVGVGMAQGVAAGITAGAPAMSAAAAAAANGARLAAGVGASGGTGGTTVNVNGNVYGGKAGTRQLAGDLERATRPTSRNRRFAHLAEG